MDYYEQIEEQFKGGGGESFAGRSGGGRIGFQ
jgi:transitional endoplasmic reticulum ATPase